MNLIYFIFPFFGLIQGMKSFLKWNSVVPIVIFGFWFGYSVFYYSGDVLHYRDSFSILKRYSWDDFFTILLNTYSRNGIAIFNNDNLYHSKPDIFAITLGFLVSRFTEEPRWFFALVGAIYFFLMSRFLKETVIYAGRININKNWKVFFLFLVLIVPFYVGVTGVRFWTALFLFGWMVLKFINTGKIRFVLYAAASCLIHYTFIFPVVVMVLTFFLNIKTIAKPLIILGVVYALLSSTTSSLDFISDFVKLFDNEVIGESASGYLNEDKLSERQASIAATNWYVQWRLHLINLFFLLFYLIDFFYLRIKRPVKSLFFERFYDIFFLVSVFTLNLGSISRFVYMFYFLVLIRLIEIHKFDAAKKYSIWSKLALPILVLNTFVTFRAGFYFVDPYLLFMPSFFLVFIESDISLSQLLIGH